MLAIGILSIGLLAIASMQISAVRGNSSARDTSEAATLAELQVETLMSLPYRFELALDNQNHAELQETAAVFDPSDGTGLGLNPAYPIDTGWSFAVYSWACQITLGPFWNFSISSLTKLRVLAMWSVFDGLRGSNVHPVANSVNRGVFKPDHVFLNVVSAGNKLVLQRALSCTELSSLCRSGFGLRTWLRRRRQV